MTPRQAGRLQVALAVAALLFTVATLIVALAGCHAPRPGYGTPRHLTAVGR